MNTETIKTFLLGFFAAATIFLLMGASSTSHVGTYQITSGAEGVAFIINTQTGKFVQVHSGKDITHNKYYRLLGKPSDE